MSSVLKRPFKIWSKSRSYNPNLNRFSETFSSSQVPHFSEYFFLSKIRSAPSGRRVVVRSSQYAYISRESIEAFRKVIAPHFRKKVKGLSKFYIRCYPHLPLMKKPAEVRMGGGKGNKLRTHVCPVRPGQVLFELTFRPSAWSIRLFIYAARKLSAKVSISFC
jgi:ribosomal protein L16/L10AE